MSLKNEKIQLKREGELYVTEIFGNKYGFKKWTWGEKNALSANVTGIDQLSGMVHYDSEAFNVGLFLKTVFKEVDGKFVEFTAEEITKIDGQLGEVLFQITQKLNLVSGVETQNL